MHFSRTVGTHIFTAYIANSILYSAAVLSYCFCSPSICLFTIFTSIYSVSIARIDLHLFHICFAVLLFDFRIILILPATIICVSDSAKLTHFHISHSLHCIILPFLILYHYHR